MVTSIDPIEYDVGELRALARVRGDRYVVDGFLWSELPDSFPPAEWSAAPDRPSTWGGSLDEREKPYLRRLPDGRAGQRIAREWIQELVERAGSDAVVEALAYYESLGWLTEGVREALEDYLLTVGYRPGGSLEDLSRTDHVQSLARTARLAQLAESDGDSRSAGEQHAGSDQRPISDEDRGWEWGGSTTEDGGWVWGGSTAEDEEAPVGREDGRDGSDGGDADASTTTPHGRTSGTDEADQESVTTSGFEFGARRE